MSDPTIPDAAVEAAARNMFDLRAMRPDQSRHEWDDLPESWQAEWRDGARAALTAAAPHIAAQALRDAADRITLPGDVLPDAGAPAMIVEVEDYDFWRGWLLEYAEWHEARIESDQ